MPDVGGARERIAPHLAATPVLRSTCLGERIGTRLLLKCENLQKTGSFKVRGALNTVLQLGADERARGVVTISAGNHAQALAWAAGTAGIPCTVVMPRSASPLKAEASRGYGAEVVLHGDVFHAFEHARTLERERGLTFVHPFDDERIIAGQGTVGLEILEQAAGVDVIVVPLGGGGLIAGIASAVAARNAAVRIYGVEPEGAAAMRKSLDAGHAVRLDRVETVADGLAPPMAGERTFELVRQHVEDVVLVDDREILDALRVILARAKLLTEPAGAAAVAALLAGRIPVRPGETVVAVLSGGNVGVEELRGML